MRYAILFSILPAILHLGFFALESLFWGHPKVNKIFNLRSKEQVEYTRLLALNQGYYNLFLSIAIFAGVAIFFSGENLGLSAEIRTAAGKTLVGYSLLSMLAAGLVLLLSAKNTRGFLIQAVPAAISLGLLFL